MTKPMIRINDGNDSVVDREMTDEEFAQWEANQVGNQARIEAEAQAQAAKAAVLERLGLTEEEARLLLS